MEIKDRENLIFENEEKKNESIILHQTSEDIISEFDGISQKNVNISTLDDKENDLDRKKEILGPENNNFADKISEKLSSIGRALKREKTGMMYCLIAHFLWTSNSIYLKFLTQHFKDRFKNKTFLFSRGLMTVIISYFLGIYQEGKIYKLTELPSHILRALLIRMNIYLSNYFDIISYCNNIFLYYIFR